MKSLRMTSQHSRAPEIYGDHWFNSEPLSIRELQGRPALLFFCNQTSLQSQALIPLFNGLHTLYLEYGLTCIGIHTPVFEFGKNPQTVEQWIKKNLILFPVLTDNERSITNAYRIPSFPAICLIDNKGDIYDTITSNIIPEKVERSVQYLLRQSGYRGELPILINPAFEQGYLLTADSIQEILTGYHHGSLGNPEGYSPELPAQYIDPQLYVGGKFYAEGIWRAERNAFTYEGEGNRGYLVCEVAGNETKILVGAEQKTSVRIEMDNETLSLQRMGDDVRKDKNGHTLISVEDPQLFSIVKKNNNESHIVKFIPQLSGVSVYLIASILQAGKNSPFDESEFRNN